MLIPVAIEPRDSDCRASIVLVEATDEFAAADKIIKIAKEMYRKDKYKYDVSEQTTLGGDTNIYIRAEDTTDVDDELGPWFYTFAIIPKLKETPKKKIKKLLDYYVELC